MMLGFSYILNFASIIINNLNNGVFSGLSCETLAFNFRSLKVLLIKLETFGDWMWDKW